jgi:small GTP-binding protein
VLTLSKKVCLLGDFAVGKTSLVRRFVYDLFDDQYLSTIGVKVSRKTITVARGQDLVELTMMLWDLAGSEEFTHMRASYLRGASGVLLVGDLARPATFDALPRYVADVDQMGLRLPLLLAANKIDLLSDNNGDRGVLHEVQGLAQSLSAPLYFTSALTGGEVEKAFRYLGRMMVDNDV